jgi:hypothetical protein
MRSLSTIRAFWTDCLDRLLKLLKWPVAMTSLFFLPSVFLACWPSILQLLRSNSLIPFALGAFAFFLVYRIIRKSAIFTWLWVLEHELVHLITGILCLKIPKRWRVSSKGGHVGFDRGSNWFITISPYVFPLIPLLTLLCIQSLSTFLPLRSWVLPASLGFAVATHIAFTWRESEFRQPDIQRVSALFALLIVPTTHLIFLGSLLIVTASPDSPVQPLSQFFREIASNGTGAWKTCATSVSKLVLATQSNAPPEVRPSIDTQAEPQEVKKTSTAKRFYFQRRDKFIPNNR